MLIDWANTTPVLVGNLPVDLATLRKQATRKAVALGKNPRYGERLVPAFLVAYVRHRYTNYETLLERINRHGYTEGPSVAQEIVWERVNKRIEEVLDKQYGEDWR